MVDDPVAHTREPMMRLFLAVEMPEAIVVTIAAAIEPWRETLPNVRWVRPENWHITLKFLGATTSDRASWVGEIAERVARRHGPITVGARALGGFPSAQRARVLWAGVDDPVASVEALVLDLESDLAEAYRTEMRRFHPHVTVGRAEPPVHLPAGFVATSLVSAPVTVDRIVLFWSRQRGGVTTYEPLRIFPLVG